MATYSAIITAFKAVVTATYPENLQVVGTTDEISQAKLGENQELFGLFRGFKIVPALRGNTDETQDFGFYVGQLDTLNNNLEERQAIIDACETKAKAIIQAFEDSEQGNLMSIETPLLTPYYMGGNETTSGLWVTATIRVNQGQFC